LAWLKSIDGNLRTRPKHFCIHISKSKRNDQSLTQIKVGDKTIAIATTLVLILLIFHVFLMQTLSGLLVFLFRRNVGPDEISNFIIKGCFEIFTCLLSHIFNLSLVTESFPLLWKQAVVVPIFTKDNSAVVASIDLFRF
jgi:hypothetical protein